MGEKKIYSKHQLFEERVAGGLLDPGKLQLYKVSYMPPAVDLNNDLLCDKIVLSHKIVEHGKDHSKIRGTSLRFSHPRQIEVLAYYLLYASVHLRKQRGDINQYNAMSLPAELARNANRFATRALRGE